jgi:PAS domain S-box-containing protein
MNRNYQDLPTEFKEMLPIIFSSATEAILVVDRSGKILMVNPGATRLFGYGEGEMEGVSVDKLLPDALQKHHAKLRETYYEKPHARPMGVGLDLEGMKKDGSRFSIEVSLNHMQFEEKMCVVAFIVDVTAQRRYQKQLKEYSSQMEQMVQERTAALEEQVIETQKAEKLAQQSVETYKMIARNFPHGTINVFDRDLRYLFVEGKELFEMGITSEELFGAKYTERLAPEIAQLAESNLQKVFEGEAISFEIEHQKNYYKINAVPLLTDEQGVSQILVVEQNITDKKLAEQEIEKALEKEQKLGQLKSKFVTLASHEFPHSVGNHFLVCQSDCPIPND